MVDGRARRRDGRRWSLLVRDAREHDRELTRDLGGIVLTAVSMHPDLIGDVFLDDDLGVQRRQWWFRDRDWTESGFQAPARVLAVSQQTRGGPYDTAGTDPEALKEAALLFSLLGENLTRNTEFDAHKVDPEAKIDIAIALTPYHGAFVAAENAPSGRETDTSQGRWMVSDALGNEGRIVPVLEANVLLPDRQEYGFIELYGIAGSSPQGRHIIEAAQARYYLDLSTQYQRSPGDLSDLAEAVIRSESLVNGAVNAEAVDSAVTRDAVAVQRAKEAVTALTVVSAGIPLPGAGAIGAIIATAAAGGTAAGQSALESWLTEQVATGASSTITAFHADEDTRLAHAKLVLATTVAASLRLDVPPPTADGILGDVEPSACYAPEVLEQMWLDRHCTTIDDVYRDKVGHGKKLEDVLDGYDESVDGTEATSG